MGAKYIERANNNITFKFLFIIITSSNEIFIFHVFCKGNIIIHHCNLPNIWAIPCWFNVLFSPRASPAAQCLGCQLDAIIHILYIQYMWWRQRCWLWCICRCSWFVASKPARPPNEMDRKNLWSISIIAIGLLLCVRKPPKPKSKPKPKTREIQCAFSFISTL